MTMDPQEQRECALTSSWEKLSLDVPIRLHSPLMTVMMLEALMEQMPWGVG